MISKFCAHEEIVRKTKRHFRKKVIKIDFLENARPNYPAKQLEINYKTWEKTLSRMETLTSLRA